MTSFYHALTISCFFVTDSKIQRRSQDFCIRGVPNGNCNCERKTERRRRSASRGVWGHAPPGNFQICGPQKWHLLDSEHKFLAILASIEASISKKGSSKSRVPGNFYGVPFTSGVPSLTSQLVYQPEVGAVDASVQKCRLLH